MEVSYQRLQKVVNILHLYLLPMCPITHVPHPQPIPQGHPSLSAVLTNIPFTYVPHCPCVTLLMCQKDVKLSKGCQIVKKMSNVKKSNT